MPRVKFLEERIVQDEHRHDPSKQTVFKAGEVYELSDASYQHWLARAPLELEAVSPSPLTAAPASVAPAPQSLAGPSSFTASSEAATPEEASPLTFEEPPGGIEKSPPKPGGKPKG